MPILTANERIGTEIGGRYRITRLIGEGAFGAVFESEHLLTGRAVALKLLHAHLVQTEQITQRFLLEAQAMAKIRHPSIVQVLDAGREADGTIFLALELLEGETLEATLGRSGRMTRHEAIQIAIELLDALAAAHARDIVHRDIKPANIFLAREDGGRTHAKLLDFGIAHMRPKGGGKLTNAGMILGTPEYMSPEQGRGAAIGPAADLWSTGVVLYEMLSGLVPWTSESATALLMAVASDALPDIREFVPDLPDAIVAVLARALEKRPEDRFASAAEMRDALARALHDAGESLHDRFAPARLGGRGIGAAPTPTPGGSYRVRASSPELPAVGARGGGRELDFDLAPSDSVSLDLDVAVEPVARPAASGLYPAVSLPPPSATSASSAALPAVRPSQLPPPPDLPPPPPPPPPPPSAPRTTSTAQAVFRANEPPPPRAPAPTAAPEGASLRATGKHPVLPLPPEAPARPTASQSTVRPTEIPGPRAPARPSPTLQTADSSRPRTMLLVGLPLVVITAGVVGMLGLRFREQGPVVRAGEEAGAGTRSTLQASRPPSPPSEPVVPRELVERFGIALPFGVSGDDARSFGRHLTLGPLESNGLRTLGTCARGVVYLYAGGDGLPVGSGPVPVACEQHDLAVVPDLDGDGEVDVAAVTRGHDGVAFIATRPMRVLRTVPLPRAQGLVGGLVVGGQPAVVAYAETRGPTGATELVAIGAQSGQILWRTAGQAPLLRLGHPADVGLAIGPDATGDGVPDVVAGATVPAALPMEQMPARPRCVELFSGASGERVWSEPFCQGRGGSQSVSLGPDLDGDGRGDVAVGTDVARPADGRVVLLSGAEGRVLRRVPVPSNAAGPGFGWPVHLGADLDGDGAPDLAVGSVGSTGTYVSVISTREGALVGWRELRGGVGFPNLRVMLAEGLIRGGVPALVASSPEDGLHVYLVGPAAPAR